MARSQISEYDKAHIEDIIRGHGDWFSAKLLRLIRDSSPDNREAIREAFPEHVEIFERWWNGEPLEDVPRIEPERVRDDR